MSKGLVRVGLSFDDVWVMVEISKNLPTVGSKCFTWDFLSKNSMVSERFIIKGSLIWYSSAVRTPLRLTDRLDVRETRRAFSRYVIFVFAEKIG